KLAGEQVEVTLAFSDIDKAKLHIQFAERRAGEMVEMARQGKTDDISMLTEQIAKHVGKVSEIGEIWVEKSRAMAPSPPQAQAPPKAAGAYEPEGYMAVKGAGELKVVLSQSRVENLAALRNALDKAPEELKPVLQQAIEDMEEDYNKTISIIESGSSQ
ncbi:MAG TPA: DUF5667 domain-containing protein, partial [Dehalococcoidia bacterium]|nr:DUF5667 domain-containing protein [Dehalococcoidia bacterium]